MPTMTSSQTIGPFFHFALMRDGENILSPAGKQPASILLQGRVIDGEGLPVSDAMIEIWQADPDGRYPGYDEQYKPQPVGGDFSGFGRAQTDEDGWYQFETLKPGAVPAPDDSLQAPHINVSVFARGLLKRLATRVYFADEAATESDPVLKAVPPHVRKTLVAEQGPGTDAPTYRFDIILQGEGETAFFDL